MLVLTRHEGESIRIGADVVVTFVQQDRWGRIKVGIAAPREVPVVRTELLDRPELPPSRRGGGVEG